MRDEPAPAGGPEPVNLWRDSEHVAGYLGIAHRIPHRTEGEATLLELLPPAPRRVLDLGTGDGRLLDLVRAARPGTEAVACDFSPSMLDRARARFAGESDVAVVAHDLQRPLPESWGRFDVVVSSFAIHHVDDDRKRALDGEVFALLTPGGVFANLDHVASPTPALHEAFLEALGTDRPDDPSNRLAPLEPQLAWLRAAGFDDVDCLWKWRELALLVARRPGPAGP